MLGRLSFRGIRCPSFTPCRCYRTKSKETIPKNGKTSKVETTITAGSDQHNDLPSFLEYAARQKLSPTSPVYVGTRYEYLVAFPLRQLGFTLTRTGRASDYGIDLLGHWSVPSHPSPLRVLLQCKAHAKSLSPAHIRELEGAFTGAPAGWKGEGVMGFLAATSSATKGMRDALVRSKVPMGYLQVTDEGRVLQFIWNNEATVRGLEGMGVTARYGPEVGEREVVLTWKGWSIRREEAEVVVVEKKRGAKTSAEQTSTEPKKRGRPRKLEASEAPLEKKMNKKKKVAKTPTKAKTRAPPKKVASKSRDAKASKGPKGQRKKE
ncbi:hypothetical protein EJ08DRAFT_645617 [Tothia fuscella]|uniref:Restriction endonuclease type IV Mrr domain-containing protein n=1 Tax=Tothia fuscella TaxID=1048955 RepID=A0A9P4P294_9PEZI|nr:hypothetical protein EJ08DRAFT_645617 [Tothia fuscella]